MPKKMSLPIKVFGILLVLIVLSAVIASCLPKKENIKTNAAAITITKPLTDEQKQGVTNFINGLKSYYQQKYSK